MDNKNNSSIWATGLAMFSMFFGAGNVVFPLALGKYAQDQNLFAILGMLITAVGVPFIGLAAMTLYDGNYKEFFGRVGRLPGFAIAAAIMALIGPFGGIPRCIALSYSTIHTMFPGLSLPLFSVIACLLIFLFTFRRNSLINVLGLVLTPLLLGSLGIIIVKGLLFAPGAPQADHGSFLLFLEGLKQGYQTMDLLGAFFFSSVVLVCLKKNLPESDQNNCQKLISLTLKASCLGAGLLSLVYIGFSYVASFYSSELSGVDADELISRIAVSVLGPYAGFVACLAVALACLTTAIALAAVFAEFIQQEVSNQKLGYVPSLIATLVAAFFVSTMNFNMIAKILLPILIVSYPALIVLSLANLFHKLRSFRPVKSPVLVVFIGSLGAYLFL